MIDVELRRTGVSGSDIAAICGLDPRRDAFDVYQDKVSEQPIEIEVTPRMKWGKRLEKCIADAYAEETGRVVEWRDTTISSLVRPWQIYTPDAIVFDIHGPIGGLDAKNVAFDQSYLWGDSGTQAIPDWIALQAHWYCSAADVPWWDIAALFGGHDLRIYRMERDAEVEGMLLDRAWQFMSWVKDKTPPKPTGTDRTTEWLKKRFPKHKSNLRPATREEMEIIEQLRVAKVEAKAAERALNALEAEIKMAIEDGEGLTFGKDKITWRRDKDTVGTDWQAAAQDLAFCLDAVRKYVPADFPVQLPTSMQALESAHQTVTREGARKLLTPRHWTKGIE